MIKTKEFKKLANRMINACKRLHAEGILAGPGGNISLRTSIPTIILCSPTGVPLMDMLLEDICIIDISDEKIKNYKCLRCKHEPTSEILLHIGIYNKRPQIKAIIHSHPPITTAFYCTTYDVNYRIYEDPSWYIGDIESIPFISSAEDLAEAALPKLKKNYALILRNHGIFSLGDSILEAVTITELIENTSKLYYYARMISAGNDVVEIPKDYWTGANVEPRQGLIYHDEIFD